MSDRPGKSSVLLLGLLLGLASGCPSKPAPSTADKSAAASSTDSTGSSTSSETVNSADSGFGTGSDVSKKDRERSDAASGYLRDVFFDFDRFEVKEDQRSLLQQDADWLRGKAAARITIEGHCDERGTAQYNLALGEKRAHTVKDYLTSLGIDGSRITVVSLGKERPFVAGHDEESWGKNRRAHFVLTTQ